ncbi:MAG: hypothetical protein K2K04_05920 [Clostridia bacterium]|nr:hypothetical protein [Clostridia bacterium]
MKVINFNPLGKTFSFRLTENTCSRCKVGSCPLDLKSVSEIKNFEYDGDYIQRGSAEYCLDLGKKILNQSLHAITQIQVYYYKNCNHYDFNDGQHRTCVTAHLMQKNVNIELPVKYYEIKGKCPYCKNKEEHSFQINISGQFIRRLCDEEQENEDCGFLYAFEEKDEL